MYRGSQCFSFVIEGKCSFDGKSLHDTGLTQNPYEKAIFIIGNTLEPLSEDNMIQCYGFGDSMSIP